MHTRCYKYRLFILAIVAVAATSLVGTVHRARPVRRALQSTDDVEADDAKQQTQPAGRDVSLWQAWNMYCHQSRSCAHQAHIPKRAYLISLPRDQDKKEHSLDLLEALGLEVEVLEGIDSDQVGSPQEHTRCLQAGIDVRCRAGLTQSHVNAWKALAASGDHSAWVFEDDIILHDDFLALFPRYWAHVPSQYEFVLVGQIPRSNDAVSEEAVTEAPEALPWGTHAYIVSAEAAERLARLAEWMFARSRHPTDGTHASAWQLDGEDTNLDHFTNTFYTQLAPLDSRRRWMVFESTMDTPFRYNNVTWARNLGCQCDCADVAACARDGAAPAEGTGLVAQHRCRERVEELRLWHKEMSRLRAAGRGVVCQDTKGSL